MSRPPICDLRYVKMSKEPPEIFDLDAIAATAPDKVKLRAKAFDFALRIAIWQGGNRPVEDISKLANDIVVWCSTGKFPNGRK